MEFIAVIKRRFRKSKTIKVLGEDMMYATHNVHYKYPKHKLISIDYANH